MGWHYILSFRCKLLPEFVPFIEKDYLRELYNQQDDEYYRYNPREVYNEKTESGRQTIADLEKMYAEHVSQITSTYTTLPKHYKDIIDIWLPLKIGYFYEYDISGDIFTCEISKKVTLHAGDLHQTYMAFLHDIIVPMSSEIIDCKIKSDDYGETCWRYTDAELRGVRFNLQDKIKTVKHTYNEDRTEIIETRVIYKHSIKQKEFLDLDRSYDRK